MPRLIIDDREIDVPVGTRVIEAAERLGIIIPRFCYHKGLGSVGACRVCAVKFLQGPFKGVQMSCMVDAQDGMVVSTTDEEAVDFRRHVIEWLMINHPHDCPVCDEGGQCLLQDMTVAGGHGRRRFQGRKRTHRDQYLGALIQHEMNRCIQCYRCVRFYREFAGYRDLGVMQIAHKVYFGRFSDGPLESPFSGNLADVCPTGVFTDKPARFRARRWDLERGPSLCIHCSLGCGTVAGARYREVLRQEARLNEAVNGYFICDRGRHGFAYASHPQRPRQPRIGARQVGWKEALQAARTRLAELPPASVACLGSARSSVETMGMLQHLGAIMGWSNVDFFFTPAHRHKTRQVVARLDKRVAVSMPDMEKADFIVAVGVDPVNEAPMLALAMRQARRGGATVAALDPRPVFLPFDFEHLCVPADRLHFCLAALVKAVVNRQQAARLGDDALRLYDRMPVDYPFADAIQGQLRGLIAGLAASRRPVLVCGTDIVPEAAVPLAADLALLLREAKEQTGLFYVLAGANAFAAALLDAADGHSFADTLEAVEAGTIKALVVVENDPFWHFPDRARLQRAVEKLELLLVLDYLPSETVARADIFLPTRTLFETRSSFINQQGRLQVAEQIHQAGTPIWQASGKSHPPRLYGTGVPGGEPKPAWEALNELAPGLSEAAHMAPADSPWPIVSRLSPAFSQWASGTPSDGISVLPDESSALFFTADVSFEQEPAPEAEPGLLLVDWTFGTEELAAYSEVIHQVEPRPYLCIHPADADKLGLAGADRVRLELDGGTVEVGLQLSDKTARGTLVVPRHRQLAWQKLRRFPLRAPTGTR